MSDPQFTLRAMVTGLIIGALLAPCNIYSGLKIGWSFNMSITAALLAMAFWQVLSAAGAARPFGLYENTINQTGASAAASIVSSGLAAPIPALALLTGQTLSWFLLAIWLFAVSLLGVVVAMGIRRQMLLREQLVFPAGVATAETLREIYARGGEAVSRVRVLVGSAVFAGLIKFWHEFVFTLPRLAVPVALPSRSVSAHNLGIAFDPSMLMIGFGMIIGLRIGATLLIGALFAWGVMAPWLLAQGWVAPGTAGAIWYAELVEWLLWPGVSLMVTSALTAFVLSLRSHWRVRQAVSAIPPDSHLRGEIPVRWFLAGAVVALIVAVAAQISLFGIALLAAVLAVLLSFILAVVAARVSGETGITPIGAVGKVTQASFALISPGNATNNLMAANVTGGATDQCADLLHDLKAGLLLGAQPRLQVLAQVFGILTGALVGSATYLLLIPDPKAMLLTPEWPAPAVATWKAVAVVLQQGVTALPPGTVTAMALAALAGVMFAVLERRLPARTVRWLPSAPALGLAFVIPAWNSISLFIGAVLGAMIWRWTRSWAERFLLALAAGLVAGESLAGVTTALVQFLGIS